MPSQQPGVCRIHGVPMTKRAIKVVNGHPKRSLKLSPHYLEARETLFLHCDDIKIGPCTGRTRTRKVYVCDACNEARLEWLKEHHPTWHESHEPDER